MRHQMAVLAAILFLWMLLVIVTPVLSSGRHHSTPRPKFTKDKRNRGDGGSRASRGEREDNDGGCELEISCKSSHDGLDLDFPMAFKLPIRGPRGPPGPPGEKGDRGDDGLNGLPGLTGVSAPIPTKIAFFVGLSENLGPVSEHTDIVFDRVVTNVGSAYNSRTGRFTSPVNATYQFNVVISAQGKQKAAVMIVRNGGMVATVWAESIPYWATASNVVILSLDKGDEIWLLLLNRASYLHGYMYSTFSGFLLFEN